MAAVDPEEGVDPAGNHVAVDGGTVAADDAGTGGDWGAAVVEAAEGPESDVSVAAGDAEDLRHTS